MHYSVGVPRAMICFAFSNNLSLVIHNVVNMAVMFAVSMSRSGYVILTINRCLMESIKLPRRLSIAGPEILGH